MDRFFFGDPCVRTLQVISATNEPAKTKVIINDISS
jgi:hypothetical protein